MHVCLREKERKKDTNTNTLPDSRKEWESKKRNMIIAEVVKHRGKENM